MPDQVERILMRYQSQDFEKVINEQKTLADRYERTSIAQDKVTKSGDKLVTRMGKLSSFGRDLRQAGNFLGNDTITALGNMADGFGDVAQSMDAVMKKGGGLGKVLGIGGAIVGGVGLGASLYDATVGKLQGGNTAGNILDQMRQFAEAGFNQDQLGKNMASKLSDVRFQIESAQITANNAIFDYRMEAQKNTSAQNQVIGKTWDALSQTFGAVGLGDKFKKYEKATEEANVEVKRREAAEQVKQKKYEKATEEANVEVKRREAAEQVKKQQEEHQKRMENMLKLADQEAAIGRKRLAGEQKYKNDITQIDQETRAKRLELAKAYAADAAALDEQYYAERSQVAAEYGIETARMEQDHQRDLQRMQQDHDKRLRKLAESRDALGIEDEMDAYRTERQRAEEDYQVQAARRSEDFARQLAQMEQAHRDQEAARKRQYQQQLAELQAQEQQKRAIVAQEYALMVQDIVQAFADARAAFAQSMQTTNTTNNQTSINTTTNVGGSDATIEQIQQATYSALIQALDAAGLN